MLHHVTYGVLFYNHRLKYIFLVNFFRKINSYIYKRTKDLRCTITGLKHQNFDLKDDKKLQLIACKRSISELILRLQKA